MTDIFGFVILAIMVLFFSVFVLGGLLIAAATIIYAVLIPILTVLGLFVKEKV